MACLIKTSFFKSMSAINCIGRVIGGQMKLNFKKLSLILNFAITQLFIEINGRNTLGQGALKLETMTARILPILNCINLDFWN